MLPGFKGPVPGVTFIDAQPDDIAEQLVSVVGELGGPGETQIIGATKRGPNGIHIINQVFHQLLTPGRPSSAVSPIPLLLCRKAFLKYQ